MGDRTQVELTVLAEHGEFVEELANEHGYVDAYDSSDGEFSYFDFENVNYGELTFQNKLIDAGIAYDMRWSSGGEFSAGTKYSRFTPGGQHISLEVYDTELGVDIAVLMSHIDDHEALKQVILQHKEATVPLPWDNQAHYGKLFMVVRLIADTQPS